MTYLLDTNVFIQAKNLHYGLDFCPAFWDWLLVSNAKGRVWSVDKIADEIAGGADELSDWVRNTGGSLFRDTDADVFVQLGKVADWVTRQKYEAAAINTFMQVADYYLVAHALAGRHIVVTHEIPANSLKRIKIPNVCQGIGIACISPYQMLRREGARFVLGKSPSASEAKGTELFASQHSYMP